MRTLRGIEQKKVFEIRLEIEDFIQFFLKMATSKKLDVQVVRIRELRGILENPLAW